MMTNSVQPCDICGDIGFTEFIATCFKCFKSREHIFHSLHHRSVFSDHQPEGMLKTSQYASSCKDKGSVVETAASGEVDQKEAYCMRFTLKCVPKSWYCEACRSFIANNHRASVDGPKGNCRGDAYESSKRQLALATGNLSSGIPQNVSSMESYATKARDSLSTKPFKHFFFRKYEKANTGRVKCIPVEAACKLISGAQPNPSSLQDTPSSNMGCFGTKFSDCNFTSLAVAASKKTSPKKGNLYESSGLIKSQVIGPMQTNTVQKQDAEVYQPLIGKSPSCLIGRSSTSENSEIAMRKLDSISSKDYISREKPVDDIVLCEEVLPNPPTVNASWEGRFEIFDFPDKLYVQAYPPAEVSPNVHLFSRGMPKVLLLKLQSQRDLWPEIFSTGSPSELDIALYFLAGKFSRETYTRLLELMEKQGLCMESQLNGAELLLFTSKQLPNESQRINKQFYLWGVFQSSKGRHSSVDHYGKPHAVDFSSRLCRLDDHIVSVTHEVDDQLADTEIDTERDREVEAISQITRSNSMASCWNNSLSTSHPHQPIEKGIAARHLHQVKREQCDDYGVPPGVSRFERSIVARVYQMRGEQCDDYDAPFSRFEASIVARYLHKIKREQYDDFDAPGFSSSTALGYSKTVTTRDGNWLVSVSPTTISPVSHTADALGFSELIKPKERDYLLEHSVNVTHEVDDMIVDMEIDMEAGIAVGSTDTFLRSNSMAACGDNSLAAALSTADLQPPVENCTVVSDLHQTEIKPYGNDAPPGFSNSNAQGFSRSIATMAGGEVGTIDMKGVRDVGQIDQFLRRKSMAACLNNSLDSCRGHSHQPAEESNVAKELHQMRIEQCDDHDAPPGFPSSNALGFSRPVTSMAGDEVGNTDIKRKREVGHIDKCLGSSSLACCCDNSLDVLFKANSQQPLEKSNVASKLHQMETELCDDYDAPPGFSSSNTIGFSRPVTSMAGGEGPFVTSPVDKQPLAYPVYTLGFAFGTSPAYIWPFSNPSHAPPFAFGTSPAGIWPFPGPAYAPGFAVGTSTTNISPSAYTVDASADLINLKERDPSPKVSPSSDGLNPEKQSDSMFCKICNLSFSGKFSFMQHLAGKRHAKAKGGSRSDASILPYEISRSLKRSTPLQFHPDGRFCKICKVPCTGIVSFRQHLAGKQHAARLQEIAIIKISGDDSERQLQDTLSLEAPRERSIGRTPSPMRSRKERTLSPVRSRIDRKRRASSPRRSRRDRKTRSPSPRRSKRRRISRSPSPTRSRGEGETRSPNPTRLRVEGEARSPSPRRSMRDRKTRSPSQRRSKRHRISRSPSPTRLRGEGETRSSRPTRSRRHKESRSPSPTRTRRDSERRSPSSRRSRRHKKSRRHTPRISRRDRKTRSPSPRISTTDMEERTPSPRRDKKRETNSRSCSLETPIESNVGYNNAKLELKKKTDSPPLARKRRRDKEKKREERTGAMGDENQAKKISRFMEKKIDQESENSSKEEEEWSSSSREDSMERTQKKRIRREKWRHHLFHEINKSPSR